MLYKTETSGAETASSAFELESKIGRLTASVEEKIAQLDPDIKRRVDDDFPEILEAFNELKSNVSARLRTVVETGEHQFVEMIEAFEEMNQLFDIVASIVTDGLEGFSVTNNTNGETKGLESSVLTKQEKDEKGGPLKTTKVVFNFVPTKHHQARVSIEQVDEHTGKKLSFRIDYDEERGEVFIDIDTPGINEALNNVQDESGEGHHFKSESLSQFIQGDKREKFSSLVVMIKAILEETPSQIHGLEGEEESIVMQNMLEQLKNKFNK